MKQTIFFKKTAILFWKGCKINENLIDFLIRKINVQFVVRRKVKCQIFNKKSVTAKWMLKHKCYKMNESGWESNVPF